MYVHKCVVTAALSVRGPEQPCCLFGDPRIHAGRFGNVAGAVQVVCLLGPAILSWNPRLELYSVPCLHQVTENGVDHPLLLEHVCAAKLLRADLDPVHGPTAARYVLNHQLDRAELLGEAVPYFGLGFVEEVGLLEGA